MRDVVVLLMMVLGRPWAVAKGLRRRRCGSWQRPQYLPALSHLCAVASGWACPFLPRAQTLRASHSDVRIRRQWNADGVHPEGDFTIFVKRRRESNHQRTRGSFVRKARCHSLWGAGQIARHHVLTQLLRRARQLEGKLVRLVFELLQVGQRGGAAAGAEVQHAVGVHTGTVGGRFGRAA